LWQLECYHGLEYAERLGTRNNIQACRHVKLADRRLHDAPRCVLAANGHHLRVPRGLAVQYRFLYDHSREACKSYPKHPT
jgi:hypothetical protein